MHLTVCHLLPGGFLSIQLRCLWWWRKLWCTEWALRRREDGVGEGNREMSSEASPRCLLKSLSCLCSGRWLWREMGNSGFLLLPESKHSCNRVKALYSQRASPFLYPLPISLERHYRSCPSAKVGGFPWQPGSWCLDSERCLAMEQRF